VEVVNDGPRTLKYSEYSDGELFLITAVRDRPMKLANDGSLTFLEFKPELSDEDLLFEDFHLEQGRALEGDQLDVPVVQRCDTMLSFCWTPQELIAPVLISRVLLVRRTAPIA
jgi:hypothetical protein